MRYIKADADRACLELGGIEAFTVVNNTIWAALVSFNALVRISTDTWKVQFVARFPGEDVEGARLFSGVIHYQGKLIFCPMRAENIVIYDMVKNSFISIPLNMDIVKNNKVYKKEYKTEDIVLYHNYAYIIGCSYPAVIRISLRDMSLKYITQPFDELDKGVKGYSGAYFGCVTRQGNCLYAGCCLSGDVLKFSLEDETYEIIGTEIQGVNAVAEKKNTLLLTSFREGKGYIKRQGDGCYRQMKGLRHGMIVKVIDEGEGVYLFCFNNSAGRMLFRYDFAIDEIACVSGAEEGFYNAVEYENRIYATFLASGKIMEINMGEGIIKEHVLSYSGTILRWMMKGKEIVVIEDEKNGLKKYLDWVVETDEI